MLCFLGWALLSCSPVALAAPLLFALGLARFYAPNLDVHLRRKYGHEPGYRSWRAPAFAPPALVAGTVLLVAAHWALARGRPG